MSEWVGSWQIGEERRGAGKEEQEKWSTSMIHLRDKNPKAKERKKEYSLKQIKNGSFPQYKIDDVRESWWTNNLHAMVCDLYIRTRKEEERTKQ